MRPENWYDLIDERIRRAKELGWTTEEVGKGIWLMNDPEGKFSGLGYSEDESFRDVLADAEIWDEVTNALYPATPKVSEV